MRNCKSKAYASEWAMPVGFPGSIYLRKRNLTVLQAGHFLVVTKPATNLLYRVLRKRHQTV